MTQLKPVQFEGSYHVDGRKLTVERPNSLVSRVDLMLATDLNHFSDDTMAFQEWMGLIHVTFQKQ